MEKVKVGILGLGAISGIYLKNLSSVFRNVEISGIYDLIEEKAEKVQEEYHIPKVYKSMEEMLDDPEIEIVLNLTRPLEHYQVTKAALLAGKHVYSEKPLATTFEEGRERYLWQRKEIYSLAERRIHFWVPEYRPARR